MNENLIERIHGIKSNYTDFIDIVNEIVNNVLNRTLLVNTTILMDLCTATADKNYDFFYTYKKNGGKRLILNPNSDLKYIQKAISLILQQEYSPSLSVNGFCFNRNVKTNAKMHVGNIYVFNLDLKDFFHSITKQHVIRALINQPFLYHNQLALIISALTIVDEYKNDDLELVNVLPQGSPASPIISNIVCSILDEQLNNLAKKFNINYSIYADDITFSGKFNMWKNQHFKSALLYNIKTNGFQINYSKVRVQHNTQRQVVTGLVVNTKVNIRRKQIKFIRNTLHVWEKYGYKDAEKIFYFKNYKSVNLKYENYLKGYFGYLKTIRGEKDHLYQKFLQKFKYLLERDFELINEKIQFDTDDINWTIL